MCPVRARLGMFELSTRDLGDATEPNAEVQWSAYSVLVAGDGKMATNVWEASRKSCREKY